MPNVMIRQNEAGQLTLYVAKKDLEETVLSIEYDNPDRWGGDITLADGSVYNVAPMDTPPSLPITLRAKRVGDG